MTSATEDKTTRVRWFLVFWMFILSVVAFLDRVNISIAGSSIADAYHLSNVQLGNIFSALLVGYALFQAPGGRLADRFGPRRLLAAGVVWWGIFTGLTALVPANISHALLLFIVIRFLLGIGEAVVYPASNQFVARWIPAQERGVANGWIFAGVGVGAGLSPPVIAYLMVHYGWRMSFWVCAVAGLVAGIVWYLFARDTPAEHPGVSRAEFEHIQAGLTIAATNPSAQGGRGANLVRWGTVLKSKEVLAITFSYFCFGYVAWIFFSWFFIYLARVRGLNLKSSAFYSMLPPLAMAVCSVLGGALSDRLTRWKGARLGRCIVPAAAIFLAAGFLALGSSVESARVASVVLAGGAGALYLAQSSFWSVTAGISGASSGSVSGFMNTGGQLGGALTASLTPWIAARFGWTASFMAAAALCTLGATAWFIVDPSRTLRSGDDDARRQNISEHPASQSIRENSGVLPGTLNHD
jgi:MFS transporter, ACS family, glucarate transporter